MKLAEERDPLGSYWNRPGKILGSLNKAHNKRISKVFSVDLDKWLREMKVPKVMSSIFIDFRERKGEKERERRRERETSTCSTHSYIYWFLYMPRPRIEPATLVYGDNTLTHWATQTEPGVLD